MTSNPAAPIRVAGQVIPREIVDGIRAASRTSGVSFRYLLAQAHRESAFQPKAAHEVTGAAGLHQFTPQTWLELMRRHGADYGLGELTSRISRRPGGEYGVADPAARQAILDLRGDSRLSSAMAAEYARANKGYLEKQIGRPVNEGELYLAHFLGPAGAVALLRVAEADPSQPATEILPKAAKYNGSVFRDGAGTPRSVAEVVSIVTATIDRSMHRYAGIDPRPTPPPIPQPRPAGLAALMGEPETELAAEVPPLPPAAPPPAPAAVPTDTVLASGPMPPPLAAGMPVTDIAGLAKARSDRAGNVLASMPMPPPITTTVGQAETLIDVILRSLRRQT